MHVEVFLQYIWILRTGIGRKYIWKGSYCSSDHTLQEEPGYWCILRLLEIEILGR